MIEKRVKNIFKLTVLILARQIWKLICNLYHLINEPFLTLRLLKKERDKSQIFLLVLTAISPFAIYATARFFWDHYQYGFILNSVGIIFLTVSILEIVIFSYLGFWICRVFRKK